MNVAYNIGLRTKTIAGEKQILDSEHVRYVRGGVTIDASTVTADGNGIKKLDVGTFLGKQGNGKYAKYVAAVKAYLVTGVVASNNAIRHTAQDAYTGTAGNSITITLANNGASKPLQVTVSGKNITVQLATDAGSAITSTAAQVIAAINNDHAASSLVVAANESTSNGTGVVAAVAQTNLAGGTDANVTPTCILAETVQLTNFDAGYAAHADAAASAIDHGRVISARLPAQPDAVVKANIPGVAFA